MIEVTISEKGVVQGRYSLDEYKSDVKNAADWEPGDAEYLKEIALDSMVDDVARDIRLHANRGDDDRS